MFEKILIPLDGSELGDRVLTQARRVLLAKGAKVILVRVLPESGADATEDEPTRHLQRVEAQLEREGAVVETRLLTGEPAATILAVADEVKPSLIALSSHGRSGIERWVRGSVAERILQRARSPLLMVNPFARVSGELSFRRILVALDGSDESSRILPLVHDLARAYESEVVLAHVAELPAAVRLGEPLAIMATDVQKALREQADSMLSDRAQALGGVSVRRVVVWGSPASELLDLAAREKADLLALTTHGRSGVSRWLYGSVAEHVLRHVASPILVLRTSEPRA